MKMGRQRRGQGQGRGGGEMKDGHQSRFKSIAKGTKGTWGGRGSAPRREALVCGTSSRTRGPPGGGPAPLRSPPFGSVQSLSATRTTRGSPSCASYLKGLV